MNPSAPPSPAPPATDRLSNIVIDPAPGGWETLVREWRSANAVSPHASTLRRELGLPVDRTVILTGHQADVWHPGILAKHFAAEAAAARLDAAAAWIVVDQDSHVPGEIRYPVRDKGARLGVRRWEALPRATVMAKQEAPLAAIPAEPPAGVPRVGAGETIDGCVAAGLNRIHQALAAHAGERSVARQVATATLDCLAPVGARLPRLYATDLSRTALFTWILERMREDPGRCVTTYNLAVRDHPEARIAMLRTEPEFELPLWILSSGAAARRKRATPPLLASSAPEAIAPRALLMTALLRLAACDLFIHGTGGGVYDKATERWLHLWLGVNLAPTAVVTATLHLPLDAQSATPAEIDRAAWRAHHAMHDPALLGDQAAAARKTELVARISELKRRKQDPAPAFAELQKLLEHTRHAHASDLQRLTRAAAEARAGRSQSAIAHDRPWAFPLYPVEDLQRLRKEIEVRFA